jgi:hypothetical protein
MKEGKFHKISTSSIELDEFIKLVSLGLVVCITMILFNYNSNHTLPKLLVEQFQLNSWKVQAQETKNLILQFKRVLMYDDTSIGGTWETDFLRSKYLQFISNYNASPHSELENLQNTFIVLELVKIKLNFFKSGLKVYDQLKFNNCRVNESIQFYVQYAENLSLESKINTKLYISLIDTERRIESQLPNFPSK